MLTPVFFALVTTATATLLSGVLAAVVTSGLEARRRTRRAVARADEVALLAAAVQRWRLTPPAWGGAPGVGFEGVSLEAIGAAVCPVTRRRRTASGAYSVVHVPSGPALDRALGRVGMDAGTDGVLVVGRDPETFETAAALVLGPLLQVPLAGVPWGLLSAGASPAALPSAALEAPEPISRTGPHPTRRRRSETSPSRASLPTWRSRGLEGGRSPRTAGPCSGRPARGGVRPAPAGRTAAGRDPPGARSGDAVTPSTAWRRRSR